MAVAKKKVAKKATPKKVAKKVTPKAKVPTKKAAPKAKTPKATSKVLSLGKQYVLAAPWLEKGRGYNSRTEGLYFKLGEQLEVPSNRIWSSAKLARDYHATIVGVGQWVVIECDLIKVGVTGNTLIPRKVVDKFNSLQKAPKGRR